MCCTHFMIRGTSRSGVLSLPLLKVLSSPCCLHTERVRRRRAQECEKFANFLRQRGEGETAAAGAALMGHTASLPGRQQPK